MAQRRLVHVSQLRAAGLGRSSIARLVSSGALAPVLPRVYAVGGGPLEPFARELAAVLWLGHDAVISHRSAAWIWDLAARPDGNVDVTIIGRDARRRESVTTHRVARLDSRDVRLRDGLPVTSPARTLIDLAAQADDFELIHALSEARVQRLVSDRELRTAVARAPTRAGAARLTAVLDGQGERIHSRREAERRLAKLIRQARLPTPEANAHVLGHEVDLVWRAQKLIVEMDGWAFHGHRGAFERDRDRDQRLVAAGYRVIRVTWRQLEREPFAVVARIAQALQASPALAA